MHGLNADSEVFRGFNPPMIYPNKQINTEALGPRRLDKRYKRGERRRKRAEEVKSEQSRETDRYKRKRKTQTCRTNMETNLQTGGQNPSEVN